MGEVGSRGGMRRCGRLDVGGYTQEFPQSDHSMTADPSTNPRSVRHQ